MTARLLTGCKAMIFSQGAWYKCAVSAVGKKLSRTIVCEFMYILTGFVQTKLLPWQAVLDILATGGFRRSGRMSLRWRTRLYNYW